MSSATEARFRVDYPNSRPRVIKVVALDATSEEVVKRLAQRVWERADFFTSLKFEGAPHGAAWSMQVWLSDLAGHTKALVEEVSSADLVVMIAGAGEDAHAASIIGEACSLRRVTTTVLIMGTASVSDEALSRTLAQLRPWALMLVIANTDEYIDDMLTALRA